MHGFIAAGHPDTAAAGAEILQQGGNAVDAAIAATFASFISESLLVNIGGGGIAQLYDPANQQSEVYDFFSSMPGQGNHETPTEMDFRQIFLDFGSAQQPFYIGRASSAVPGVVAGLCRMANCRGTLPLPHLLQPAIRLAQNGSQLTAGLAYISNLLEPIFTDTTAAAALYAPTGRMATTGERLRFPALAATLEQLGREGERLFYEGDIAAAIVADQQAEGGLINATDLANYQLFTTSPLSIDYRGYTILLPPPSSIGGVLIAFTLKLLAAFDLAPLPHNGFDHGRILAEAMRLTNIARVEWTNLAKSIPINWAAGESPARWQPAIEQFLAHETIVGYQAELSQILAGKLPKLEVSLPATPGNTTHLSVADKNGMLVSITTSAGESAGYMVGNSGVMLNNMLGEIDLHPDGFHHLQPGERLTTMMSPMIVLKAGQPIAALGSGGSNRIRSAILQTVSNLIDFHMPLTHAVEAPRIHFEENWLQLEAGFDPVIAQQFAQAGYQVNLWPEKNMFFGGTHAVACLDGQRWEAVGDPRRGGSTQSVS